MQKFEFLKFNFLKNFFQLLNLLYGQLFVSIVFDSLLHPE